MNLLAWALRYQELGFSVIPLHTPNENGICSCDAGANCENAGKHPRVAWTHWQSERPSSERLRNWWERWPDANIGIVTGAISGIVVLDIDGEEGKRSIYENELELPWTPEAATGNGLHIYLAHPSREIRSFAGRFPGIDLRGDGGYVVAPPSLHASGKTYAWELLPVKSKFAPVPDWIFDSESLERNTETAQSLSKQETTNGAGTEPLTDGDYWLDWALDRVGPGRRNQTGFDLSLQLRDAGYTTSEATPIVLQYQRHVESLGDHLYTEREALASLHSAYKQPAREPALVATTNSNTVDPEEREHIAGALYAVSETLTTFTKDEYPSVRALDTDRKVFLALLERMRDRASLSVPFPSRDAAEAAGVGAGTAAKSLQRLRKAGWIQQIQSDVDDFVTAAAEYTLDGLFLAIATDMLRSEARYDETTSADRCFGTSHDDIASHAADDPFLWGSRLDLSRVTLRDDVLRNLTDEETELLQEQCIGPKVLAIVGTLDAENGLNIGELAACAGMSRQTASRKVHLMQALRLVHIRRDGRSKRIWLVSTWKQLLLWLQIRVSTFTRALRRVKQHCEERAARYRAAVGKTSDQERRDRLLRLRKYWLKRARETEKRIQMVIQEAQREIYGYTQAAA